MTRRQSSLLSLIICFLLVGMIFIPGILFFTFLLLPTLILSYYDRDPDKIMSKSIGSLNIVGTIHAINHSFITYGSLSNLEVLMRDFINWFIPLGLALLGYVIHRSLPSLIMNWTEFWMNRREAILNDRQAFLILEWGEKVRGKLARIYQNAEDLDS